MADEPKGKQLLHAAGEDGLRLPVVITEQGETLVEPTDTELAEMLVCPRIRRWSCTISRHRRRARGPGRRRVRRVRGSATVLIEETTTGGQAGRAPRSRTTSAFPTGVSGAELATSARRQAERFGAEVITTRKAVALRRSNGTARTDRVRGRRQHRRAGGHPGHWRRLPPAAGDRCWRRTADTAAASITARERPSRRSAGTKTSTSSAARTRRVRLPCSCPARPHR